MRSGDHTDAVCRLVRVAAFAAGVVAFACMLIAPQVRALNAELEAEDVDQAYSLGQSGNREELAAFFREYQRTLKYPPHKPLAYVKSAEFQTPYEQIVLRSQHTPGYSSLKAYDDYEANMNLVIVRVIVGLKINYSGPEPDADHFSAVVSQAAVIEPKKTTSTAICNPFAVGNPSSAGQTLTSPDCVGYSRQIDLNFDISQFGPGVAKIKVTLPESPAEEISFDLDKLK